MSVPGPADADHLDVERLGGFAGFGLPGSRLRSRGRLRRSELSAADREIVDALFDRPSAASTPMPDAFRYRLTRLTPQGAQSIEAAEQQVPIAVRSVVQDELL